jgi:hypothetical protein
MDLRAYERQLSLVPVLLTLETLEQIRDLNFPAFLEPFETLEELCRQEMTGNERTNAWIKYCLRGQLQSLKAVVDVFLLGKGGHDGDRIL